MNTNSTDVVVLGAGLAGLTAAAYVARSGRTVTVLESRDRPGGQARTDERDGYFLNQGPHALYRWGAGEAVLAELGIAVRGRAPDTSRGRMVFGGELELAPGGPASLLTTRALSARQKLEVGRLLGRLPRMNAAEVADRTVDEWVADHVTSDRAAELIHAVIRLSTYGNAPAVLSAQVAVTQLQAALGKGVLYLDDGWGQMVAKLADTAGVTIRTSAVADTLPDARTVIVATGNASSASALLGRPFDVGPSTDVSCLDLGVRGRPPHHFVLGGDVPLYLSNYSAAAAVAPGGHSLVSVAHYLRADDVPDADALEGFATLAGIRRDHVVMRRYLHRMTTVSSIATAASGGLRGRPAVTDTGHDHVFLAGDWVGPDGHLADASFASGKAAALAALRYLDLVPVPT